MLLCNAGNVPSKGRLKCHARSSVLCLCVFPKRGRKQAFTVAEIVVCVAVNNHDRGTKNNRRE